MQRLGELWQTEIYWNTAGDWTLALFVFLASLTLLPLIKRVVAARRRRWLERNRELPVAIEVATLLVHRTSRLFMWVAASLLPRPESRMSRLARIGDNAAMDASPAAELLRSNLCGLELGSPIVLLSGCVGFGEEYTRIVGFSNRDAGAIVLKGTTLQPRLGNPPHRVHETPAGMLNAIGLQNPGADAVVRRILPELDFSETRFIANVSGSTIEEYVEVTRRFDDSRIDAIEINISCPNVKEGGVAFGNYPEMSARVVEACRKVTKKPLITKLSPNQTDIRENARRCIEAGSDALSVINTVMGMAIDVRTRSPVIGNVQGGLSGPAIKPIALLKVHQVYDVAKTHRVPIIGQGGIASATDALEFLIAGASAVGVGTALFYDPLVCRKINRGIADYLVANGMKNVSELVGTLRTARGTAESPTSG